MQKFPLAACPLVIIIQMEKKSGGPSIMQSAKWPCTFNGKVVGSPILPSLNGL